MTSTQEVAMPAAVNGRLATAGPAEPSTLNMLALGVERGYTPEVLEKLLELHERVEQARAVEAFNRAMRDCQQQMPVVVRQTENTQTRSKYARLESINEICKPVYTRFGFALSFGEDDAPLPGWKRIVCDVRHVGGHEVRYHVDLPLDGFSAKGNAIGSMNPVQAAISTGTYGQRALTVRIFNITIADTDKDGSTPRPALPAPPPDEQAKQRRRIHDLVIATGTDVDKLLVWASNLAKRDLADLDELPPNFYPGVLKFLQRKQEAQSANR